MLQIPAAGDLTIDPPRILHDQEFLQEISADFCQSFALGLARLCRQSRQNHSCNTFAYSMLVYLKISNQFGINPTESL